MALLMVQKEVAQRLAAKPGGKDFGSLTIFIQLFYQVRKVFDLGPGSFFPQPQGVIRGDQTGASLPGLNRDLTNTRLATIDFSLFQVASETNGAYLAGGVRAGETGAELLKSVSIVPAARPEQLAVTEFVALSRKLNVLSGFVIDGCSCYRAFVPLAFLRTLS